MKSQILDRMKVSKLTYCRKERPAEATIRLRPLALAAAMTFSGLVIAAAPAWAAQATPAANAESTGVGSYCEGVPSAYSGDCTESLQRFLPPKAAAADDDDKAGPDDIDVSNNPQISQNRNVRESRSPRRHRRARGAVGTVRGRHAVPRSHGALDARSAQEPQRNEGAAPAQDPQQRTDGAAPAQDPQQSENIAPGQEPQRNEGTAPVQSSPERAAGAAPAQAPQRVMRAQNQRPVIRVQIRRVGGRHTHGAHHRFSPRQA
jgi:hypothetical protein